MDNDQIGSAEQLKDPNYEVSMGPRVALGL